MTSNDSAQDDGHAKTAYEIADEKAVRSIPLDTEDGGTVVIEQQNMGGMQQVGEGEFKNVEHRSVERAGEQQAELEARVPIGQRAHPGSTVGSLPPEDDVYRDDDSIGVVGDDPAVDEGSPRPEE